MNVLDAMKKLNRLNDQTSALNIAIDALLKDGYNYENRLLTEIRDDFENEADELRSLLEKTPLIITR